MAHRPGHRPGGGSRRGKYGRSEGGGKNLYGMLYREGGGFPKQ